MEAHLTEKELAAREKVELRTVQKWRREATGPAYIKIGGHKGPVRYPVADVEAWEQARRVTPKEK